MLINGKPECTGVIRSGYFYEDKWPRVEAKRLMDYNDSVSFIDTVSGTII